MKLGKYMKVEEDEDYGRHHKTRRWIISNASSGLPLGTVYWYGQWRQYCFFPIETIAVVYNNGCLSEIARFLDEQNRKHRSSRAQRASRS